MKIFITFLILGFSLPSFAQLSNAERVRNISELRRFAFASCNHQEDAQPLWPVMIADMPDLFVWGGDNIYAESHDANVIKAAYDYQNKIEPYRVLKSLVPIIGTWDDHDFGYNNSNGTFAAKRLSQEYLLDFLEEPKVSPRRVQDGVYTSYSFGHGARKVKFILIDNRYFKDVDPTTPFLGVEQWHWLEDELKNSDAAINFIVSGLSVLSPSIPWSEEWADYKPEQEKLFRLIRQYGVRNPVFLTGDKHFGSIFTANGFVEFLASGMTHNTRLPLRPYVRSKFPDAYFEFHYGLVDIDWNGRTPTLTMAIRNAGGHSAETRKFRSTGRNWREI